MKLSKIQANMLLLACAIIWGLGYLFSKQATNAEIPPGMINATRGLIYSAVALIFFHKAIFKMTKTDFKIGLIAGGINFLGYQVQTTGLKYTTPANSAFLTGTYVVMIPFVVWIFLRRKPDRKSFIAIVLSVIGMMILTGIFKHGLVIHFGDALTILSALLYALQIVYFGASAKDSHPLTLSFMLGATQGVFGLVWSLLFEHSKYGGIHWQQGILPILFLGIISSFGGQTMQIIGQRFTDATVAGIILMTESLFGSVFSVVFGFEPLTTSLLEGGVLILCAILLMQVDFKKMRRSKFQKQH
jgi:drug/metabolite transporter (DMT)-like permease